MMSLKAIFLLALIHGVVMNVAIFVTPVPKLPKLPRWYGNLTDAACGIPRPPNSCEDFPPRRLPQTFRIDPPPEWTAPTWAPLPTSASPPLTRIIASSCNSQTKNQDHWLKMIDGTDLSILMGDNVYGDCLRDLSCTNLELAYYTLAQNEQFRSYSEKVPSIAAWDDHDYGENDGGADFHGKERAKELFLKFYDIPASDDRRLENHGLYTSYYFGPPGQTLQVIILDVRWYKGELLPSPQRDIPGFERYMPSINPLLTVLGNDQWGWLERELKKPAQIRLLVSSFQLLSDSHGFESWRAAKLEQLRLIQLCEAAQPRPYILSGDRHFSAVYKKGNLVEITSSSLTSTDWNHPGSHEFTDPLREGEMYLQNSYVELLANWTDNTVAWKFISVGNDDDVPHPSPPPGDALQPPSPLSDPFQPPYLAG